MTPTHAWPDALDLTMVALFAALIVLIPLAGYVYIAVDVRAYLRSMRRQLMLIVSLGQDAPWWSYRESPPCLIAFGLTLPCTEDQLKQAYREKVKELHPDRGGDQRRFLKLQAHFEAALKLIAAQPKVPKS